MKKLVFYSLSLFLGLSLFFAACKKSDSNASTENTNESQVQSDDHSMVSKSVDDVANDASLSVENSIAITGNGPMTLYNPCDATITYDTLNAIRTLTITYNGTVCPGRPYTRTGVVTVSIPAGILWRTAGAQLTITITNLKITRISDGKSITINGIKYITNVSGGLLRNLATHGPITHTIVSPGMTITFDNGSQRSWQIAKQRVFNYDNGIVISTTGTHSDGGITGIAEWGTNRFGNAFVTSIIDPMVIRQDCDFRITGGHIRHSRLVRTVDVTFGLDSAGNPTSCPGTGSYYMKIVWVNAAGQTMTVIMPY